MYLRTTLDRVCSSRNYFGHFGHTCDKAPSEFALRNFFYFAQFSLGDTSITIQVEAKCGLVIR